LCEKKTPLCKMRKKNPLIKVLNGKKKKSPNSTLQKRKGKEEPKKTLGL